MAMELSRKDEACRLDHMVSEDQWRLLTGIDHELEHLDDRISNVITIALRQGRAPINFSMSAAGVRDAHGSMQYRP